MKICFFCDSVYSYGGVQRVLAVIAKELSSSHDVTIMTMDRDCPHEDIYQLQKSNVKIIYFQFHQQGKISDFLHKPYSWLYKSFLPKNKLTSDLYALSSFPAPMRYQLIQALNSHDFEVIIGVHAFLSIKLATIRKQLHAEKVIGWMHNSYQAFFELRPAYLEGLKNHFQHQMQKLDNVIVLTHTDADLYMKNLKLPTTVIYNPLTIVPGQRCDINSKTFLSVGRMSPRHKGFDILIKAFVLFAKQDKEWKLNIVGDGPEKDELLNLIKEKNIENKVTIYPFTRNIQQYYSSSSIYILSSRWEGLPLVLMEAISHGLPIIASDIPVCQELLAHTSFCTLFKSEDIKSLAGVLTSISQSQYLKEYSDQALEYSRTNNFIDSISNTWKSILID